jgi:hypothetical protein
LFMTIVDPEPYVPSGGVTTIVIGVLVTVVGIAARAFWNRDKRTGRAEEILTEEHVAKADGWQSMITTYENLLRDQEARLMAIIAQNDKKCEDHLAYLRELHKHDVDAMKANHQQSIELVQQRAALIVQGLEGKITILELQIKVLMERPGATPA